ncbi:MAG: hypothetical protein IJO79_03260 [Firmicutes bacterium]|nr:hypothetical protein [Bacillota bacterium]
MLKPMKFPNTYFFTGTAYAGKSTMVKCLAKKHNGIACEENYHNVVLPELDKNQFPGLCYTRDLEDWHDFIRRTPDEYEAWINRTSKECEIIELELLSKLDSGDRPVFVDTNISLETLWKISDQNHVMIMLADPEISVKRFFERPDREKQFLYRLLMEEADPAAAIENFRACLARINSVNHYNTFLHSGFQVMIRNDRRTIEETMAMIEKALGLI